jgi:hypothetical protein
LGRGRGVKDKKCGKKDKNGEILLGVPVGRGISEMMSLVFL